MKRVSNSQSTNWSTAANYDLAGTLWKTRSSTFRQEMLIYARDVARSGFPALLFLLFIGITYMYNTTLETLPASFPYLYIVVPILLMPLVISPIRTYLRKADAILLLAAENRMQAFFRRAWFHSIAVQSIVAWLACLAIWPLYKHCNAETALPFIVFLLYMVIFKTVNLMFSWQQGRLVYPQHRRMIHIIRWVMTAAGLLSLFLHSEWLAFLCLATASFIIVALIRKLPRHSVHWSYLVEKEQQHLANYYLFFSWFTDVPVMQHKIKRRERLASIVERVSFSQRSALFYLFAKTSIRSEWLSMTIRLAVVSTILIAVMPSEWFRSGVWLVTIIITTLQLTSLKQMHRHSFWLHLYPVQLTGKQEAIRKLTTIISLIQTLPLGIALWIRTESPLITAVACISGYLWIVVFSTLIMKRDKQHSLTEFQ